MKSCPQYYLSNGRGIQLVDVLSMVRTMDISDWDNLSGTHGIQYSSVPIWRRPLQIRHKRANDISVVVNGAALSAGYPRSAKWRSL